MSSPAGSTRSNINSMTGALAPRTRSGATYGSGAAAPSTPVRGPALRLVDPEDAALRRASADVPSFLEQAEGTAPQGALHSLLLDGTLTSCLKRASESVPDGTLTKRVHNTLQLRPFRQRARPRRRVV